ncbi:lysophospholipid acyltransferase family protein [Methylocystis echinoides]|uniref:lysophospholipid acyltransferase family protein n=1 Tax=Methylocystis echinoides TaxID=29468 RepID=UPI003434C454
MGVVEASHLRAMPYLRAAVFVLAMVAALLIAAPVQALARRRGWAMQHAIPKAFCRLMCGVIGIEVTPAGALPAHRPRFVVANHLSWTDIIALASLHPFVFLAKKEVAHWPVLGLLAQLQGTVFVARGARQEIPGVNGALVTALRDKRDLVIFAEGTSTDGATPPRFKSAHFDAACATGAMVAPVALYYTDGQAPIDVGWYGAMTFLPHLWRLMKRGGVRCHVVFGRGIEARGKDRKALAAEAQAQVSGMLPPQMRGARGRAPVRRLETASTEF